MRDLISSVFFTAAALCCLLTGGCDSRAKEKLEVHAAWDGWDQATAPQDGEAAARWVTKNTIAFYDRMLDHVLDAKPDEIQDLAPSEQSMILRIRTHAKRSQLKDMDGRAFYAWCMSQTWNTGPAGTEKIKNIVISGFSATATVYDPDEEPVNPMLESRRERAARKKFEARQVVRFTRENGDWKFDETSLSAINDADLRDAARESGMSMRALLEELHEDTQGTKPPVDVWKPMK